MTPDLEHWDQCDELPCDRCDRIAENLDAQIAASTPTEGDTPQ